MERDNGIRRDMSISTVEKLRPAFVDDGTITAANSSFLSDGASACLLASAAAAERLGLTPKSVLGPFVFSSSDPREDLLLGSAYGVARLLKATGLKLKDFDVFEFHEAFAGQLLATLEALNSDSFCKERLNGQKLGSVPMERLNTWGGSLALGMQCNISYFTTLLILIWSSILYVARSSVRCYRRPTVEPSVQQTHCGGRTIGTGGFVRGRRTRLRGDSKKSWTMTIDNTC